jgi:squalene-hopene/tetraprenyl-beta-curcumene cyclase
MTETERSRGTAPSVANVQQSIDRAHVALRALQGRDGRWEGLNIAGVLGTAASMVFERYLGALDLRDAREGERYLRAKQLADGGAPGWEFATQSNLSGTCFWYAGMTAAGVSRDDPAMLRAALVIDRLGGMHKSDILSKILLVTAGALDPEVLPTVPLAVDLIPGYDSLLAHFLGINVLMPVHTMVPLMWALKRGSKPPSPWLEPIDYWAAQRAIEYLSDRQDPTSGGWMGVTLITELAACVLVSLGVSASDPRVKKALQMLASVKSYNREGQPGLYVAPFESALWDTAQLVRALVASGMPANDSAITKAVTFLLDYQSTRPSPWDWQTPPAGAPVDGGWPFEIGNELNPDLDSTQEVLSALIAVKNGLQTPNARLNAAIDKGLKWFYAMQNPDGGWPAFSYGKRTPPPGVFYYPMPEAKTNVGWMQRWLRTASNGYQVLAQVGDPSVADVAGRTLYTLGMLGQTARDERVSKAIALIEHLREPITGGWWGMWAINFLPATSYVLTGLAMVKADLTSTTVKEAVRFILDRQNPDGGWGEQPVSYEDPSEAGRGPSMRSITAYSVWALCVVADLRDRSVRRAVDLGLAYLLEQQQSSGMWADENNQGVMLPNLAYYYNTTFSTYLALEALAAYKTAIAALQVGHS